MKVTNRFKGLDLIDRVSEELWTEDHNIKQMFVDQNHISRKLQKDKMVDEEV